MHAVVNHLRLAEPLDEVVWQRARDELPERLRAVDGFRTFHIVKVSDHHLVLVVICDSAEAVERIAADIGSQWMSADVLPHLSRQPERHVGEVAVFASNDRSVRR